MAEPVRKAGRSEHSAGAPGYPGALQGKVAKLREALNDDVVRTEAASTLRSLVVAVTVHVEDRRPGRPSSDAFVCAKQKKTRPLFRGRAIAGIGGCGDRI